MPGPDTLHRAGALLGGDGPPAVLTPVEVLRPGRVVRCRVEAGPTTGRPGPDGVHRADGAGAGRTVIVKVPSGEPGGSRPLATLHNESVALIVVNQTAPSLAPTLLAADPVSGLLVLEDLGPGGSLATALLGPDGVQAEAVTLAFARALGTLHAATAGSRLEFDDRRATLGPWDPSTERVTLRGIDIGRAVAGLAQLLDGFDLTLPAPVAAELALVVEELAHPGDFLALAHGDPCPDNAVVTGRGPALIDFEAAAFRHALIDAAHLVLPFPNCWCWAPLPAGLSARLLDAHRALLRTVSAQADDDARYGEALVRVSGAWVVWTLTRRLGPAADQPSHAVRVVATLGRFARLARDVGHHPNLARWCDELAAILADRWGLDPGPLHSYPAFGGTR